MVLESQGVLEYQGFRAGRVIPLLLSLQSDWWRSHRLGLPSVLADQVDPIVLAVQRFLNFLETLSRPLSRCILPFLSGLEVRPVLADLEGPAFLEILAIQEVLVFLLGRLVLKVHHYPSLLCLRSAPQVRGTRGLLAVR